MNANKRTLTLQDVGGSITPLSPVQFEGRFITGMANIARETRDVNQLTSGGTILLPVCSPQPQVATGVAEANVAQHVDDVFQSQPSLPKVAPIHDCAPAYRRDRTSAPHAFDWRIAGKAEVIPF